jgi:transcriptional antiterminator RfaH
MRRWYLVQTKPANETLAEENLLRQGYEVYLPRLLSSARLAGQWRERVSALFPRYLFLRLHEGSQALGPVRSSVGVGSVVRFGAHYAIVPDQVVEELQARADPQSGLHRLRRPALPVPGSKVRIRTGPFDGLEGVFEREAGSDRVIVLLQLLGQAARVRLPAYTVLLPGHAN